MGVPVGLSYCVRTKPGLCKTILRKFEFVFNIVLVTGGSSHWSHLCPFCFCHLQFYWWNKPSQLFVWRFNLGPRGSSLKSTYSNFSIGCTILLPQKKTRQQQKILVWTKQLPVFFPLVLVFLYFLSLEVFGCDFLCKKRNTLVRFPVAMAHVLFSVTRWL